MRLICPNCSAEYEVDDAAIPDGGRDVQCSNCGHGWYQLPPHLEAETEAEAEVHDEPEVPEPPAIAAEADARAFPGGAEEDGDLIEAEDPQTQPEPLADRLPKPPSLDDSVLAVLKEEAEREAIARRAEAMQVIETQPDLGLDSAVAGAVAASATAEREARVRSKPVEVIPSAEDIAREAVVEAAAAGGVARAAPRRGLLPDIEEINSTLRSSHTDNGGLDDGRDPRPSPRRGGFGRGFMLAILLALMLAVLYLMAPRISATVPALEPALAAYVEGVDAARLSLDGWMKRATGAVEKVAPPAGG